MATYTQYTEIIQRTIWEVPTPATYVEVEKAVSAALTHVSGKPGYGRDDAIMVESTDESVKVIVEVTNP